MKPEVAVEETIKMWLWLAKHPKDIKEDYLANFSPCGNWPQQKCFLCGVFNRGYGICGRARKFSSGCPLDNRILHCTQGENSPFFRWMHKSEDNTQGSLRIVNACRRWLRKHNKEVNNNG